MVSVVGAGIAFDRFSLTGTPSCLTPGTPDNLLANDTLTDIGNQILMGARRRSAKRPPARTRSHTGSRRGEDVSGQPLSVDRCDALEFADHEAPGGRTAIEGRRLAKVPRAAKALIVPSSRLSCAQVRKKGISHHLSLR